MREREEKIRCHIHVYQGLVIFLALFHVVLVLPELEFVLYLSILKSQDSFGTFITLIGRGFHNHIQSNNSCIILLSCSNLKPWEKQTTCMYLWQSEGQSKRIGFLSSGRETPLLCLKKRSRRNQRLKQ